jgi:hypothetical protein
MIFIDFSLPLKGLSKRAALDQGGWPIGKRRASSADILKLELWS